MKANESKETQKFTITKRDGNKMPYDSTKIVNAIEKANATMDRESEKASPFENMLTILKGKLLKIFLYYISSDEIVKDSTREHF